LVESKDSTEKVENTAFFVAIFFQIQQCSVRFQTPQVVNWAKPRNYSQRKIYVQVKAVSNVGIVCPSVFAVFRPTSFDGLPTAKV
jgi:hypothetical protein